MDIAVVSPHLDDGVLSLGGLIGQAVGAGQRVEVVTCFTAGPPLETIPPKRRVFADYTTRRAEDQRALAVLGASHCWLDLRERSGGIRRCGIPRTHSAPPPSTWKTSRNCGRSALRFADLLDRGALVYAPLGIGNHVDHVEVALAALQQVLARRAFTRVRFYEDSYGLSGASRRRHFVARWRMWRKFEGPAWASPRVGGLLWGIALLARGPRIEDYLPEAARLDWTCEAAPLLADQEECKLAAVAEYDSQVRTLGGIDRLRPFVRRGHRVLGGEPVWSCRSGGPSTRRPRL